MLIYHEESLYDDYFHEWKLISLRLITMSITPQTALFGLCSDGRNHDEPIINDILLIFKLHVYNSREKYHLNIMDLLTDIKEIKKTEYRLSSNSEKKERYIKINGA